MQVIDFIDFSAKAPVLRWFRRILPPRWSATLPAMLVVALGMACAVAPLTTAVLSTIEPRHAGVASGFNNAVARSGGLIATALLGTVLSARGAALVTAFRVAALVCAAAAMAAGACAFALPGRVKPE